MIAAILLSIIGLGLLYLISKDGVENVPEEVMNSVMKGVVKVEVLFDPTPVVLASAPEEKKAE